MDKKTDNKILLYNYIVIPCVTLGIVIINWLFSRRTIVWYKSLQMPTLRLSNWTMTGLWWSSHIVATIALLIIWNSFRRSIKFWFIIFFFIVTAVLTLLWHYLFFYQHLLGAAFLSSVSLTFSILVLLLLIQPISLSTALLLYPTMAWTLFVTYLNYMIWLLN